MDSEEIEAVSAPETKKQPDDFGNVVVAGASTIKYKHVLFIFLIFLLLASDTFIMRMLSRVDGAVTYKYATSKGVIIQGIILVILFMIFDFLVERNII